MPQIRHAPVTNTENLHAAAKTVGFPAVLKTRRRGTTGKAKPESTARASLPMPGARLKKHRRFLSFIDFEREISVLLARDLDGNIRFHPIAENIHRRHILYTSRVPAEIVSRAEALGARIATALGHIGMMAIELFVTREGDFLVNEIAPRTHNSGHYTFGACATSQFEQHVRAICGLPIGDAALLRPAVMLNLLGDLWADGSPDWSMVLSHPAARLHLYGKGRPSPGRKMGHVLILGEDANQADSITETIAATLGTGLAKQPKERAWTS